MVTGRFPDEMLIFAVPEALVRVLRRYPSARPPFHDPLYADILQHSTAPLCIVADPPLYDPSCSVWPLPILPVLSKILPPLILLVVYGLCLSHSRLNVETLHCACMFGSDSHPEDNRPCESKTVFQPEPPT